VLVAFVVDRDRWHVDWFALVWPKLFISQHRASAPLVSFESKLVCTSLETLSVMLMPLLNLVSLALVPLRYPQWPLNCFSNTHLV
jgi:hypothetical protein